jgi:sec-independent protein translocase protein TatA
MGSFSIWHWLIVLAIVLLLFGGGGKIQKMMKDMGQGITAFKRGLKEDEKPRPATAEYDPAIEADPATTSTVRKDKVAS